MLRWILLLFIAVFIIGCGESEQPLAIEDEEDLEAVGGLAPEGQHPTIVIQLPRHWEAGGSGGIIRTTRSDMRASKYYVVESGMLVVKEMVFQERFYYLLRPKSIDGVSVPQRRHGGTHICVLDNRIRCRMNENQITPDPADNPIAGGDELEVAVKHRFKYRDDRELIRAALDVEKNHEIIFVDVLRNLTRPDVKF